MSSLAFWLVLPMAALIVYFLQNWLVFGTRGYWLAATTTASESIWIVGTVVCMATAWEVARIRQAHLIAHSARSRMALFLDALLPTLAVGVGGLLFSFAIMAPLAFGAPGGPAWHVVGATLAVLLGMICWGLFLGFLLPPKLSLVTCLATSFLWFLVTPSAPELPGWLRHLTGGALESPPVWAVIDPRALIASLITSVGMVLVGVAAVYLRNRLTVVAVAGAALPLALVGGILVAQPLDTWAYAERTGATCADVADEEDLTLCLWPELEAEREEIAAETARIRTAFVEMGLDMPTTLSAELSENEQFQLRLEPGQGPEGVPEALSAGMLPHDLPTFCPGGEYPTDTLMLVSSWLRLTTGYSDLSEERGMVDPALQDPLTTLTELPSAAQSEWYRANRPALDDCGPEPETLDPALFGDGSSTGDGESNP